MIVCVVFYLCAATKTQNSHINCPVLKRKAIRV